MTEHLPRFVVLNPQCLPCRVCGAILPFMTASPDDPPGATTHLPGNTTHLPVVVEQIRDAPAGLAVAPLGDYPALGARVHNLSAILRGNDAE